ncbi:Protein translocase subunit secA [Oxytricha trifallax]|uniref:Protein translocase subunit secA n=1 Tax=Oxytricha trifallax TaxID=1172189 RepID=A0A073HZU0_9SPIT|nr:Protein translocase subunit secA [Oxytricha trifallax]
MTQKYFESQIQDQPFINFLKNSILIVDEYDWLIFEGSPTAMSDWIRFFWIPHKLICLTGSTITQKEETCLDVAFGAKEIKFPTLSSLKSNKTVHASDILLNSCQLDYCKHLYELCMKQTMKTPVILVASGAYQIINTYFKRYRELQFYSMKGVKGSKADAYLEGKFNVRNSKKRFGVLLLTDMQGRGTDLQTSKEIEDSGGLYLIICDVFSKRSTQQIIGRVARLENKGQWRHVLLISGSQDTVEQAIQYRQEFLENENHIKFSKLQTILSQSYQQQQNKQSPDKRKIEDSTNEEQIEETQREISSFEDVNESYLECQSLQPKTKIQNQNKSQLERAASEDVSKQKSSLLPIIKKSLILLMRSRLETVNLKLLKQESNNLKSKVIKTKIQTW